MSILWDIQPVALGMFLGATIMSMVVRGFISSRETLKSLTPHPKRMAVPY